MSYTVLKRTCELTTLLCLLIAPAYTQSYFTKRYQIEQGLPTDIVKGCAQDSLGYFWIATDEGLVKYDGISFTSYPGATHSNYTKGFLTTRSGRLLAFGDLDIIEIHNNGDTVHFEPLVSVSREPTDTTVAYPKLLYEDLQGNLWVSESQAVVKLVDGVIKRYEFEIAYRTPQFLRSFALFEDRANNLYATSFHGQVFQYNASTDTFQECDLSIPTDVEYAAVLGDQLIVGAADGLYSAPLNPNGTFGQPHIKFRIAFVSHVALTANGSFVLATRGTQHYLADPTLSTLKPLVRELNSVNQAYISTEHDLWFSSNEGLYLMHETVFNPIDNNPKQFIECITEDPKTGEIHYATNQILYAYDPLTNKNRVLPLNIPNGYYQSMVTTSKGIWIANAFKVFLLQEGRVVREYDFTNHRRFITSLSVDAEENVWLAIPGERKAYRIEPDFNLQAYTVELGNTGVINHIEEGDKGMFIASSGKESYLFFKAHEDSVFRNISLPIYPNVRDDFTVNDVIQSGTDVWLASSEGLFRFNFKTAEPANLGLPYQGLPLRLIRAYSSTSLLMSCPHGLLLYDVNTSDCNLFGSTSGLPSRTVTNNGIYVSNQQTVWVGTSEGLCYNTRGLTQTWPTPPPRIVSVTVGGNKSHKIDNWTSGYESFISIQASSITFPESDIIFDYRLGNSSWQRTTGTTIEFVAAKPGVQVLEIRAKKNGTYQWSDATKMNFIVQTPFWREGWFYVLVTLTLLITVAITGMLVRAYNIRREQNLEDIIRKNTEDLVSKNKELVALNQEKNNLVAIVAHDLKSPLANIVSLASLLRKSGSLSEESETFVSLIETSARRLNTMIVRILDIDSLDAKKLNLKMESLDLSIEIRYVAQHHKMDADKKGIELKFELAPTANVYCDRTYLDKILDNLISNAIKFSPLNRSIHLRTWVEAGKAWYEVRDEGPGISEDDMPKLFGKYQKLSAKPTGGETSSGLGLSIVKRFVEEMNGSIYCESEVGKGTRFYGSFDVFQH